MILALATVVLLACASLPGGVPLAPPLYFTREAETQSAFLTAHAPTMERVYAAPSVVYTPSATPNIVPPAEQVNPTVDPSVFETETIAPTPTACESFNDFVLSHTVDEIIKYLEKLGTPVLVPNGETVPAYVIYFTPQKRLEVSYMLAEMLRQDEGGTVLRMLQPTTFKVSGKYFEDLCGK
jgi:hypothetical protein